MRIMTLILAATITNAAESPFTAGQVYDHHVAMLRENRVQRELGLTSDQRIKLIDGFESLDEQAKAPRPSKSKVPSILDIASNVDTRERQGTLVAGTISPVQFERLQQLERQRMSVMAFRDKGVIAALKLTAEQQTNVTRQLDDYVAECLKFEYRKKPSIGILERSTPYMDKVLKSLTAEQKETWDKLVGKPPKEQLKQADGYLEKIVEKECEKLDKVEDIPSPKPAPSE